MKYTPYDLPPIPGIVGVNPWRFDWRSSYMGKLLDLNMETVYNCNWQP